MTSRVLIAGVAIFIVNFVTIRKQSLERKIGQKIKQNISVLIPTQIKRIGACEYTEKTDDDCIICLQELSNKIVLRLDCKHCFHKKCIIEWLEICATCPFCRNRVNYEFRIPLLRQIIDSEYAHIFYHYQIHTGISVITGLLLKYFLSTYHYQLIIKILHLYQDTLWLFPIANELVTAIPEYFNNRSINKFITKISKYCLFKYFYGICADILDANIFNKIYLPGCGINSGFASNPNEIIIIANGYALTTHLHAFCY